MSFKAPGSETPSTLLVHHPGFINHLCCLQNWSVKMDGACSEGDVDP